MAITKKQLGDKVKLHKENYEGSDEILKEIVGLESVIDKLNQVDDTKDFQFNVKSKYLFEGKGFLDFLIKNIESKRDELLKEAEKF